MGQERRQRASIGAAAKETRIYLGRKDIHDGSVGYPANIGRTQSDLVSVEAAQGASIGVSARVPGPGGILAVPDNAQSEREKKFQAQREVMVYWFLMEKPLQDAIDKGNFELIDVAWHKINFLKRVVDPALIKEGVKGEEEALCKINRILQKNNWWARANSDYLQMVGRKEETRLRDVLLSKGLVKSSPSNTTNNTREATVIGSRKHRLPTVNNNSAAKNKTYLQAVVDQTCDADISQNLNVSDAEWTLVRHKGIHQVPTIHIIFVGNLPSKAHISDIWLVININRDFVAISLPGRKDKNNNRFAFLKLATSYNVDDVLHTLRNISLFGRTLGFARAYHPPPKSCTWISPDITNTFATSDDIGSPKRSPTTKKQPTQDKMPAQVPEMKTLGDSLASSGTQGEDGTNINTEQTTEAPGTEVPHFTPLVLNVNDKLSGLLSRSIIIHTWKRESLLAIRNTLSMLRVGEVEIKSLATFKYLITFMEGVDLDNIDLDFVGLGFLALERACYDQTKHASARDLK